jgi:hypothetical protein
MSSKHPEIDTPKKKEVINSNDDMKPIAVILAGYNKVDFETKRKEIRELNEAYDGDIIYMGQNKFLHDLAGKPVIQYIIDAVYNAKSKVNGKRIKLYDKIFIYNDIKTIRKSINLAKYPGLIIKQMKKSVGGHLKDFCLNHVKTGQRVDLFFGDTPRITSEDVEWIHREYNKILGKEKDHRGVPIRLLYGIVEYEDMKNDNWLEHRIKPIKVGQNKGKLKHFAGFESFQARVGNTSGFVMDRSLDGLIENEAVNFFYNMRKALNPNVISKIVYYLWKTKHSKIIRQIKNRCINEIEFIDTAIDVWSKIFKIDLSNFAGRFFHIKKHAARWENDIDGPKDLKALRRRFALQKQQNH